MKKVILLLFIAFSILVAPVAHASGMDCEGNNCQLSEQIKKHGISEKQQDNDKIANADHHCCCPHLCSVPDLAVVKPITASIQTRFAYEQNMLASFVVGPPLKPPAHA
ncbi:MAG: hypothetical protein ACOYK8_00020 [Alphaproteobacteria bacterium]